jgi:hypothetical protein
MPTTRTIERISATDVRDGDIIFMQGYRCRASDCRDYCDNGVLMRYFTATIAADSAHPERLPVAYNGGRYGGNARATYGREVR